MKHLLFIQLLVSFILTGCEKQNPVGASSTGIINTAPIAFAGTDFYLVLPADSATLDGTAHDTPSDILQHVWKKISGPSRYVIDRPDRLQTKVRSLLKGTYQFELTVFDKGGLTGKDTVTVDVLDPDIPVSSEMIFKNLEWIYPWYASIEVKSINRYPTPKKVLIQRGLNSPWIEVSYISNSPNNNLYEYFIETRPDGVGMYNYGSLYIFYYGTNTSDTPAVKIIF